MQSELAFKFGTASGIFAEILLLGATLFVVLEEYEGTLGHMAGLPMVVLAVSLGIGALLFSLYHIIKWKPS